MNKGKITEGPIQDIHIIVWLKFNIISPLGYVSLLQMQIKI